MSKSTKGASAPASKSINGFTPTTRCRKGDLAIVLSSGPCAGTGLIVDVIEYYCAVEMDDGHVMVDAWEVIHPSIDPNIRYFIEDKYLLPIRPGDLDETETDELSLVKGESV